MSCMLLQVNIPDDVKCVDTTRDEELPKTSMGFLITWYDRYILMVGDEVRSLPLFACISITP